MEAVYPSKRSRFCNSFRAVSNNITKVLSDGRAAASKGHLNKWSKFYREVALEPLLLLYQDPVPILNTFTM